MQKLSCAPVKHCNTQITGRKGKNLLLREGGLVDGALGVRTHVRRARKPTHAGIDPYNYYIDRISGDNVRPVGGPG
jgi:hypothetical protein